MCTHREACKARTTCLIKLIYELITKVTCKISAKLEIVYFGKHFKIHLRYQECQSVNVWRCVVEGA